MALCPEGWRSNVQRDRESAYWDLEIVFQLFIQTLAHGCVEGTASPPDHLSYTSSTIVTCNTGHTKARSRGSDGSLSHTSVSCASTSSQLRGEFGIWFKRGLGSEVALCFIAHVQAESSQSHDGFGIWFEEDFGAEVVFWFFAHVQAESSTMLGSTMLGSTVDTCSCVSPTISLAIRPL